ncbi:MAG: KTSC domain-containing protein [Mucilaginibacter sp.]
MRRHKVESIIFKSVGYYLDDKILEVELRDTGAVYQYHNFPKLAYKKFVNSISLDDFFTARIKNKYPEVEVK